MAISNNGAEKGTSTNTARDGASFLNNSQDGSAKTKSNAIEIPSITLPKGGGAMKSIDEKFSVNAVNGTATYNIPLPFSPGRNGQTPALSLSYNSGGGKGIFGIGWGADVPAIQRRTQKKLPEYKDADDTDIFIFSGVEDLVIEQHQDENGTWLKNRVTAGGITTTAYRPRIEGGFSRIERIEESGNTWWRVRTKENVVSVFGITDDAKVFDPGPAGKDHTFKWCLEYSYDDKGNFVHYGYKKEDDKNVALSLSEKNRLNNTALFTNNYPKSIKYSNVTPYYEGDTLPTNFLFELVFDYGEHDTDKPTTAQPKTWVKRTDPFSDFKAGFEIRTYRLCQRILMFHHFKTELGSDDYLVRSLDFVYDAQPHITYLEQAIQTGYIWNSDGTPRSKKSMPPMEFSYFKPGFSTIVKEISPDNIVNAPVGLDGQYQWTDLYSEGISGILTEQGRGWFYKENLGNGQFGPAKIVSPRPSFSGLSDGTLSLQDLEADGRKYMVKTNGAVKGYFGMDEGDEWLPFRAFEKYPNIDLHDPNLKFIDLDGDGKPDMLLSYAQEFVWYASKGLCGYDDYHLMARAADEERGPQILFADKDAQMLIATADMSGDGLADIVLITPASVVYYPNMGYGKFGAKITMEMDGCFAAPTQFTLQNIHFADVDGSGTTDIIYTGNNAVQVWFNQSGNSLSAPSLIFNPFPDLDDHTKINFADLLGNGTSCMIWSSPMPHNSYAPLRYIDMMGGRKPHMMYAHKNNMGKEVTLEYTSSTQYYLNDKKTGNKWVTKLPFPVHCVSKTIMEDKVSQTRFATEYKYHHGYYDAVEREFRGFAMVEQSDSEAYETYVQNTTSAGAVNTTEKDLYQPVVTSKTWFHTGAYLQKQRLLHQLQGEYYPAAQIASGQIKDAATISVLEQYILPDTLYPKGLTAAEYIEYCRSLKGLPLRQEIYSDEGTAAEQVHPYSVVQHNYDVQLLQERGTQPYAVFLGHEKETLSFNFERNPLDPRIAHTINVAIDPYGNVTQGASIVYGRKNVDADLPTAIDQAKQTAQHITYTQAVFTTLIDTDGTYRLPIPCEMQTWELNTKAAAGPFFISDEINSRFATATVMLYEQDAGVEEKRKIEHSKTLFLKNDLTGPVKFGTQDTLGLPYENYLLAFTPSLLADIYSAKYSETVIRDKGGYIQFDGDKNYWIPSGRVYFHPDTSATPFITVIPPATAADVLFAKSNFYLPIAYQDNFGNLTKVFYDSHKLSVLRSIDAAKNETNVDGFNYRTLSPYLLRDANDNRSGARYDELGMVTHAFVMGKAGEYKGDLMDTATAELSSGDQPTSIIEYDFRYYTSGGLLPCMVKTSMREQHYYKLAQPSDAPGGVTVWLDSLFGSGKGTPHLETGVTWQLGYSYSDGSGHEVLKKIQAEPGLAPKRKADGTLALDGSGNIQLVPTTPLRWIGNGKTISNNKGKPVKQYEPYFDSTPEFNDEDELVMLGYTSVIYYDALGRIIKTDHPDGSFAKVEFDAWKQKSFDANDTVKDSKWYTDRINGGMGADKQQAAKQTLVHYNTPATTYLDSLARPFLSVEDNTTQRSGELTITEEIGYTRSELDIEGNARSITNAINHEVMSWKYDMLGNICYQKSSDAGERWMLADIMGKPLRLWDSRSQVFSYEYDELHRPLNMLVDTGAGDIIYELYQYGEGITGDKLYNLRGKLYKHFDTAGATTINAYDFNGNFLANSRQLLTNYKTMPDWATTPALDAETFVSETSYDALNRPVQIVAPDASIFLPGYSKGGQLTTMDVVLQGAGTAVNFISTINYDAKRQREQIYYGNNTTTRYVYDLVTYRLTRLLTTANAGANILQDLNYTYDPVGNITRQYDNAQKTVFYDGDKIEATNSYIYDALYRLVEGQGREHTGHILVNKLDNWDDSWCNLTLHPNSPMTLRKYTQKYFYDKVGNISQMRHITDSPGSWTRNYAYDTAGTNQLTKTTVSTQDYKYDSYNPHGSMLSMPHLTTIDWNFKEEMQHVALGGGGDAWYVYDSSGQRVRKVVETGSNSTERIYLGAVEIYRERTLGTVTLERQTLQVMDQTTRVAMVDTRTFGTDPSPAQLIRYQYSDHLGSACLELDDLAKIISYEEYHPFGTSAYRATDFTRQVPAKRYRYTGMERDDETGLNYHKARHYVPWLGRWIAADPLWYKNDEQLKAYLQHKNGNVSNEEIGNLKKELYGNLFAYATNNPVKIKDLDGCAGEDPAALANAIATHSNKLLGILREEHGMLRGTFEAALGEHQGAEILKINKGLGVFKHLISFLNGQGALIKQTGNLINDLEKVKKIDPKAANDLYNSLSPLIERSKEIIKLGNETKEIISELENINAYTTSNVLTRLEGLPLTNGEGRTFETLLSTQAAEANISLLPPEVAQNFKTTLEGIRKLPITLDELEESVKQITATVGASLSALRMGGSLAARSTASAAARFFGAALEVLGVIGSLATIPIILLQLDKNGHPSDGSVIQG